MVVPAAGFQSKDGVLTPLSLSLSQTHPLGATATPRAVPGLGLPCLFIYICRHPPAQLPLKATGGDRREEEELSCGSREGNKQAARARSWGAGGSDLLASKARPERRFERSCDMGEQENNKIGGSGNNAMAVDESGAAANKGKSLGAAADPRLQAISDAIRVVPHFPKPGPPPSSPTPTYNQSFG
jgi:hypothetical protein